MGGGQFSSTQTINLFLSKPGNSLTPFSPGVSQAAPDYIYGRGVYGTEAIVADANGDGKNDLILYEGKAYDLRSSEQRKIPIMDIELLARLRKLGTGREWVFQSRNGTPINPRNARHRFLKPAAKELGIKLCGWHDFRHSLTTELRRNGTHPKVISDLLGHKKVNLAMDVYDRSNLQDFEQALRSTVAGSQLLPSCDPKVIAQ
jgi:site-specific recombinase XerC